ncbi:hypothetical protein BCON_0072g00390 [Botryotinia convoluta]|uniref:Ketoreductase (KR) domain-containing protein n=1 Tax=Botryotinia convoluta TaxID=54673 RepID=A0A4Z1IJQ5_9HELO|nr:hypothetical protein BCON_0072g00390 [Botryotinia convoluta]
MALSFMLTPPPTPTFTEKNLSSQKGKVFIVTGGNQGVGFELIKMLYPTGARIYMAARSASRAADAMREITKSDPANAGNLRFLLLDLMDLHSVRAAADAFREWEEKLDILWNNAGIGGLAAGEKTVQGVEGHMGVNVLGPWYFARLLGECLGRARKEGESGSVSGVDHELDGGGEESEGVFYHGGFGEGVWG